MPSSNVLALRCRFGRKEEPERFACHPLSTEAERTKKPRQVSWLAVRRESTVFPFLRGTVALNADLLAAYSGGTAREFHPLPFSLIL